MLSVGFCHIYTSCQRSLLESGTGLQDSDFSSVNEKHSNSKSKKDLDLLVNLYSVYSGKENSLGGSVQMLPVRDNISQK